MDWPKWWDEPTECTGSSLSNYRELLIPTGIEALDDCLGGLRTGCIYEITGEAGSGKTNLALEISQSLTRQNHSVCYINTFKPLSADRLFSIQMSPSLFQQRNLKCLEDLTYFLHNEVPLNIQLLVIDSITTIFRDSESTENISTLTTRFAVVLKHLSYTRSFSVICVNNVSAAMDLPDTLTPCLGLSWANSLNYRFFLLKQDRSLRAIFSDCAPFVLKLQISDSGVQLC